MTDNVHDLSEQLRSAPVAAEGKAKAGKAAPAAGRAGSRGQDRAPPLEERRRGEIWPGCPVTPLGINGEVCFYLDRLGQLRAIDNHTVQSMLVLFGGDATLLGHWFPTYDRQGNPQRGKFSQIHASAAMITACTELGLWARTGRQRGPGFWADDDGGLVYHAGDEVLIGGDWQPPGVHDGKVYAASDPLPRPLTGGRPYEAPQEVLDLVQTWAWRRPDVDPQLVLGIVLAGMVGGALDWRPVAWLTGDAATGKSTFQKLLLYLHGGERGLLQAADATEAGIRSVIGFSSLPVAIDELEPDPERPQKARAVIELARRAASGGQIFRGSASQDGHQSVAFSAFLFSSILVPDMPSQDRSRLILLDLDRLPPGTPKVTLDPRRLRSLGAALRRLLIDRWHLWPDRLDLWRAALAAVGQTGRGADNYGTVLALADLVQGERPPDEDTLANWAGRLSHAVTEDTTEVGSNADDMLTHLMSQPLDIWRRGQRHTVAKWVAVAARLPGEPTDLDGVAAGDVNRILAPYGLRVLETGAQAELVIANKPIQGLCDLFERSVWRNGVWSQAASRVQGAQSWRGSLNRINTRASRIPLASIPGMLAFPADRHTGTPDSRAAPPPDSSEDFG